MEKKLLSKQTMEELDKILNFPENREDDIVKKANSYIRVLKNIKKMGIDDKMNNKCDELIKIINDRILIYNSIYN